MEETLTVHRLGITEQLRRTFTQHQCHRVGLLDRGDGLPQCEALARGGSDRALGGFAWGLTEPTVHKIRDYEDLSPLAAFDVKKRSFKKGKSSLK